MWQKSPPRRRVSRDLRLQRRPPLVDGDNADMGMLGGGGGDAAIPNPFEALSLSRGVVLPLLACLSL